MYVTSGYCRGPRENRHHLRQCGASRRGVNPLGAFRAALKDVIVGLHGSLARVTPWTWRRAYSPSKIHMRLPPRRSDRRSAAIGASRIRIVRRCRCWPSTSTEPARSFHGQGARRCRAQRSNCENNSAANRAGGSRLFSAKILVFTVTAFPKWHVLVVFGGAAQQG
jgi:hypothetical protein